MLRFAVRPGQTLAIGIASVLLLAGCTGHGPQVVLDTPTGPTTLYSPAPEVPGVPPPPGMGMPSLQQGGPPPPPPGPRSGTYAGVAEPLDTGGGICIRNRQVGGFHVHGNAVRYGQFRGTIGPDNGLQMVSGQTWIYGQFEGPTFRGQLDIPAAFNNLGCTYMLTLNRVGP
jgi:hypothetical protein